MAESPATEAHFVYNCLALLGAERFETDNFGHIRAERAPTLSAWNGTLALLHGARDRGVLARSKEAP